MEEASHYFGKTEQIFSEIETWDFFSQVTALRFYKDHSDAHSGENEKNRLLLVVCAMFAEVLMPSCCWTAVGVSKFTSAGGWKGAITLFLLTRNQEEKILIAFR